MRQDKMSLQEFKVLNEEKGFHWFSKDTMSFFSTKVEQWSEVTGYFITSDISPQGDKAYSIRKADFETGQVSTVGEFHSHKSFSAAVNALVELRRDS